MMVLTPTSLPELYDALALSGARALAGGTDLLVRLRTEARRGENEPTTLVRLDGVPELRGISITAEGAVRLGACSTHAELLDDVAVRENLAPLGQALAELGSPAIRNMGTLGGNLCTASPAGDCLPPLTVLEAQVEIGGPAGLRRMPLAEFITGPGCTRLEPGEAVLAVEAALSDDFAVRHFEKVGRRGALAIAVVSLAALLKLDGRGRVAVARLAWGSVGPAVWRCPEAEAALLGVRPTLPALKRVAAIVRKRVSPIDDVRASAEYRREVAGNLLLRLAAL